MVIVVLLLNSQLTNECSKISEYMTLKLMRELGIKSRMQKRYRKPNMDLYSRKIIAHKLSRHMTTELVVNVLNQACETRTVKAGLILHTDLGSQYRSTALETALKQHAIRHSYSKRGYSYDNSVVESFHASFKKEEVYQRTYKDYHEANLAQFSYIEGFIILGGSLVPMAI